MPLYIRDDTVDDLAVQVMKLTGARSKTDAVRMALLAQIDAAANKMPLLARLEPVLKQADALGGLDSNCDRKVFTDGKWDDL